MIFGWDISTSVIGVSQFTDSNGVLEYVKSYFFDMKKYDCQLLYKAELAAAWIDDLAFSAAADNRKLNETNETIHFIEDKLSSFSAGKTMQQTLLKLAAFNATISYIILKSFKEICLNTSVVYIHPTTVKSIMSKHGLIIPKGADKKQLTLDFVLKNENKFVVEYNKNNNPKPYCYDMADSYITAKAGYVKFCIAKKS